MSNAELTAYKRRCVDVIASESRYDANLVALCRLVEQTASR
jgi:hypothetical protein